MFLLGQFISECWTRAQFPALGGVPLPATNLPAMQYTWVWSLSWEDLPEKEMATHSNILTWEIPWTEKHSGLQSMESQRVGHDLVTKQQQQCIIIVLPVVQERRLLETMQLAIGEFITDSSQGLPPSPRVWGRKGPKPQFSPVFIRSKKAAGSWHKWIGYTVGSWRKRIGCTVARQFLLAQRGAFSFPRWVPFFLLGTCWLAGSKRPDNYVTPGNQACS